MSAKHLFRHFLFAALFLFASNSLNAQIFINEFVASNDAGITDDSGAFEDWVELYNAGSTPVNIANYYVSDDLAAPTLWQIPDTAPDSTTIGAGDYLILWFDKDIEEGVLHVDAKLSGSGEDIVLTAPDGVTIEDSYSYGPQLADVSEGRITDGASGFTFFTTPTPGETNAQGAGVSPLPVFSAPGGLYANSQTISISTASPANIYYTTDGSEPNQSSNLYTGPLSFSTATPLRAIAVATDLEPSTIVTETYLIGISHVYPIMALTGNPSDFFDEETGIFGNFEEDLEININTEFYEPDGTLGFNQMVESELVGVSSAANAQKSLALKAKGSLGSSKFDYPVFPDEDLTEYRSLMLRNSGNDWNVTQFRDASVSSLIRDLSDVDDLISPPQINYQAYRPCIAYINGEYWGLYNLRERSDKRYIKHRFDLDDDEIDFLENEIEVKEGDILDWNALQAFLANNNFADEANYAQLAEWVDLDEFMDLIVYNIFIDNQDWPGNNNRRFRERVEDGKWRFLSYDIDFVFGLLTSAGWNMGYAGDNALDRLINPSDFGHPNPEWSARLFYKLLENENWRNDFINRTADHLNVLFSPTRVSNRIDEFLAIFEPEFDQQLALWQNLYAQEENADLMKAFGNARTDIMHDHYIAAFPNIDNTAEISIFTEPAGAGSIEFSTLNIDEEDDIEAWTGTYFTGINIPVKAVAKPGFVFQYWEGVSADTSPEILVNLSANGLLKAVFGETDLETQAIGFSAIPDQETTADPITLNASSTSGLPVSFSVLEGPAMVSGNTLTLTGEAGIVVVQASQEGDATYAPATPVEREFAVFEPFYDISFSVDMNNYTGAFSTVYLSGDFNSWSANANLMEDPDNDGIWTTTIELLAGVYEYKFQLDESAVLENLDSAESCVNTTGNREVSIAGDTGIPTVCWESCNDCAGEPVVSNISFSVDMNDYTEAFSTVYLSGGFNNWSVDANPMEDPDNDGIWTTTVELALGVQEYKFVLDEGAVTESLVAAESCVNASANRELSVVGDADAPAVCWETCVACIVDVENIVDSDLIFSLQPVPAQDYTSIVFNQNYQSGAQIYVSDALGRLIYTAEIESGRLQKTINTSNWSAGTYFVRVSSENKLGVRRLLITK
jgi:hypothetical protein